MRTVNAWIFDPKNQLYRTLLERDIRLRFILTNVMDRRGSRWAVWGDLRDPASAEQLAFDMLPDERPGGASNQFFTDAPRHVVAGVLRELVRLGRPFTWRHVYLLAMDWAYARQLFERSPDPVVRGKLVFMDPDARVTSSNVHASLLTKLGNLATYAALSEHARDEFSVAQAIRSDVVVVLGSDFRYSHILGPMNALLMKVLRQQLLAQGEDEPGNKLHLLAIDEFPQLNYRSPAEDFPDFCELGRSKDVRVCLCAQTTQQIKKLYGEEVMDAILGNCQNKLIFRVSDRAGAAACSDMLPYFHGYERTRSGSVGYSGLDASSSRSWQEARADRPIVPPSVLQHLPLADWKRGWSGYGIAAYHRDVPAWRDFLSPEFLAATLGRDRARELVEHEHEDLSRNHELIVPYEQCLRTADEQRLEPLEPHEVASFGLDFEPDGHRS